MLKVDCLRCPSSVDKKKKGVHQVAKAYNRILGLDFGDTLSSVAKMTFVYLFLSMASMRNWPLHQVNIKDAFLHCDLIERNYTERLPVAQGESRGYVCRLHKALSSLKQCPRAWFGRLSTVLLGFGMIHSKVGHSKFYRNSSTNQCIYRVVYVDDIVIT